MPLTKSQIQALINAARTSSADLVTWNELKAILEGLLNQDVVYKRSFIVGEPGAPTDGTVSVVDAALVGDVVLVFRNGVIQNEGNMGDGDSYITRAGTSISFFPGLSVNEKIIWICLDL